MDYITAMRKELFPRSGDVIHPQLRESGCGYETTVGSSQHVECVNMLLDRGAEVNMQEEVSGVIRQGVHAMQHVPRVQCSG